jgi:hypothetical protein
MLRLTFHPPLATAAHAGDEGGPVKIERIERVIISPAEEGLPPVS